MDIEPILITDVDRDRVFAKMEKVKGMGSALAVHTFTLEDHPDGKGGEMTLYAAVIVLGKKNVLEDAAPDLLVALEALLDRVHTLTMRMSDAGLYGLAQDLRGGANPTVFQRARAAIAKARAD